MEEVRCCICGVCTTANEKEYYICYQCRKKVIGEEKEKGYINKGAGTINIYKCACPNKHEKVDLAQLQRDIKKMRDWCGKMMDFIEVKT
jgi:hypothetical protein